LSTDVGGLVQQSIIRNVTVEPYKVGSSDNAIQRFIFTGNGGGKVYNQMGNLPEDSKTPGYRHILIDGTYQPLSFYMFHIQRINCQGNPMAEIKNSSNVSIYAQKSEIQDFPPTPHPYTLRISDCNNISIIGGSGMATPSSGYGINEIYNSTNITIANYSKWNENNSSYYYVKEVYNGVTSTVDASSILNLFKRTDGDTAIDDVPTSVEDQIKVFPNPLKGLFTLKGVNYASTVNILNIEGKTLRTLVHNAVGNMTIDISEFPSGFYLVQVKESGATLKISKI